MVKRRLPHAKSVRKTTAAAVVRAATVRANSAVARRVATTTAVRVPLLAPRRALTVSKALRWRSNVGLVVLNTLLLRWLRVDKVACLLVVVRDLADRRQHAAVLGGYAHQVEPRAKQRRGEPLKLRIVQRLVVCAPPSAHALRFL